MSIKADIENLLIQLDYPVNEATKKQLSEIIENTKDFYSFAGHLFSLKDELNKIDATVAMSNSHPYLKIKSNSKVPLEIEKFEEIVKAWSNKYKVALQKLENKNTYYILGKNS